MPAAEREVFNALTHELNVESRKNILLLSHSNTNEITSFLDVIGTKHEVIVVKNWNELQTEKFHAHFDAAIINKVMRDAQIIDSANSEKLEAFIRSCLNVLKVGGIAVMREDLNGYLATEKVNGLTAALDVYRTVEGNKTVGFDFKSLKEVDASIHTSQNFLDLYWVLKKSEFLPEDGSESKTFRDFLDKTQYTDTGIFAYEWIFGDNFISPGGAAENLKILKQLGDLKSGQTMLDIGVGIGGGARQAAAEFGLHVLGIDLSSNMLSIALDRLQRDKDTRVRYSITDAMKCEYPPESFDYIFSRDGLHHNDNLGLLIKRLHKCLKPNGRILITVYGKGHGKFSKKFSEYVANRQYHLLNLEELIHIFEEAGFKNVKGVDLTQRFKDILMDELTKAKTHKSDFLKRFTEKKYEGIVNGWMDKLGYIEDDNHCWLQVSADRD